MKNGKPIAQTSATDPMGFGLGVNRFTLPKLGDGWSYTGETFGYRVAYVYLPREDAVFAIGMNSAPDSTEDSLPKLEVSIYETLRKAGYLTTRR
jgi:D-alanyl-D-alanine carboxypeptidase